MLAGPLCHPSRVSISVKNIIFKFKSRYHSSDETCGYFACSDSHILLECLTKAIRHCRKFLRLLLFQIFTKPASTLSWVPRLLRGPDAKKNSAFYLQRARVRIVHEAAAAAWANGVPWAEALRISEDVVRRADGKAKALPKKRARGSWFDDQNGLTYHECHFRTIFVVHPTFIFYALNITVYFSNISISALHGICLQPWFRPFPFFGFMQTLSFLVCFEIMKRWCVKFVGSVGGIGFI